MAFRTLVFLVFSLIFVGVAAAQGPGKPCGDGICDQAEQANPNLCPQDCTGANNANSSSGQPPNPPQVDPIAERALLPEVTTIEKWQFVGEAGANGNFAQSVVPLESGGYRMYWNTFEGIGSAISSDGVHWTAEEGLRLAHGQEGDLDCKVSHPWVIAVEGGYRMYYQADAVCREGGDMSGLQPEFRILSAFSSDGLNFEREAGVRVDIGESTGLSQAAHGRAVRLPDGTFRMIFSANFIGKPGMADLLGATSTDGLTWTLDDEITLEHGHDPALVQVGDTLYMYASWGANLLVMASQDGYEFTPTAWVEFYDTDGTNLGLFGDVDVLLTAEGKFYMYGIGIPGRPILIFEKMAE